MNTRAWGPAAIPGLVLASMGVLHPQEAVAPDRPSNWGERREVTFADLQAGFAAPSRIYAPFAFWFFDAPLDPAHVAAMAAEMCRQGMNPGYAHPRRGLPREEWLSPLWFDSLDAARREAEAASAFLSYCDEYYWPSGRADGRVLAAQPDLAAVSLACRTFDVTEGETVELPASLFTVAARHARPFTVLRPQPALGQWIWHPDARGEGRSSWFRCPVTVPPHAEIAAAVLSIAADNRFTLHVNGVRLAEGSNWEEPTQVDLASVLRPGVNLLAIEAGNDAGPCGLIFGLRIDGTDGSCVEVGSGAHCRASAAPPEGWTAPGFDDSAWAEPVVLGPAGADPWRLPAAGGHRPPALIESASLQLLGSGPPFAWTAEDGAWRVYSFTTYHHAGIDGSDVNYLDRRLIPAFLAIAHAPYERRFGSHLGDSIPGVFVDNEGDYGFKLAWSDDLDREYRERTGRDIRLALPLLLDRDEEGSWPAVRWSWYDAVSALYADTFLGGVSRWLEARGMYCISNLWEESLTLQAFAVGDFFLAQRTVTMPGNDCLVRKALEVHDFKETQSVTEFENRRFQSEILGVAGWQMSPVLMKQAANAVIAWGVSHIVPHGVNVSRRLETIPYPPDWFTSNPYWRHFHLWTDFCRRASYVNSHGHLVPDVLLVNPMDSVWALLGGRIFDADEPVGGLFESRVDIGEPGPAIEAIEAVYRRAIEELTAARIEYLVADRHYLRQMRVGPFPELVRGPFKFQAVVVPSLYILPVDIARRLVDFARLGGTVYLLGDLPQGSSERGLGDPEMDELMRQLVSLPTVRRTPEGVAALAAEGAAYLEPEVRIQGDEFPLLALHRRIGARDFFWLANNAGTEQDCTLSFRNAHGAVSRWDCESGSITDVPSLTDGFDSTVELAFGPYEACWVVFDTTREAVHAPAAPPRGAPASLALAGPWRASIDPAAQPPPPSPGSVSPLPESFAGGAGEERPLASWLDWGLGEFTGFLDYTTSFSLAGAKGRVVLDLGEVRHMAEVWVNGRPAGARLWPPFRFDVTALVAPGENEVKVRVGNLLCNAMKRFGRWGWVAPEPADFDAGLRGPVAVLVD
ncbi:MAG: glycosylhydrolase-like jelly roll fold domain-containing protein [Planctomycetota bacterium]